MSTMGKLDSERYDDYDEEWDTEGDQSDLVHPLGSNAFVKPPLNDLHKVSIKVITPRIDANDKDVMTESIHSINTKAIPPPPPRISVDVDIGDLAAREAARRVKYARRRQAIAATQKKELEAATNRHRHEVRLSNKPMHRALGVADLTPDQRLNIGRKKLQAKQRQEEEQVQPTRRWYNVRPYARTKLYNPTVVCNQVLQETHRAKRETQRLKKKQSQQIEAKLRQLDQTAKLIVTKAAGGVEYVRGSYLLKKTHKV